MDVYQDWNEQKSFPRTAIDEIDFWSKKTPTIWTVDSIIKRFKIDQFSRYIPDQITMFQQNYYPWKIPRRMSILMCFEMVYVIYQDGEKGHFCVNWPYILKWNKHYVSLFQQEISKKYTLFFLFEISNSFPFWDASTIALFTPSLLSFSENKVRMCVNWWRTDEKKRILIHSQLQIRSFKSPFMPRLIYKQ